MKAFSFQGYSKTVAFFKNIPSSAFMKPNELVTCGTTAISCVHPPAAHTHTHTHFPTPPQPQPFKQISVKFITKNNKIFIQENEFENVCEMLVMLSQPQCIDS